MGHPRSNLGKYCTLRGIVLHVSFFLLTDMYLLMIPCHGIMNSTQDHELGANDEEEEEGSDDEDEDGEPYCLPCCQ